MFRGRRFHVPAMALVLALVMGLAMAAWALPVQAQQPRRETLYTLEQLQKSMAEAEARLDDAISRQEAAPTEEAKARIEEEIKDIEANLDKLGLYFEAVATGVDMEAYNQSLHTRFDLGAEVQEILGPIIHEMRKMTTRPRELERLRNEVEYLEKRIPMARQAIRNIDALMRSTPDEALKANLAATRMDWEHNLEDTRSRLTVAQYQLDKRMAERKSVIESAQELIQRFFKTRGRNMLLFLLTMSFVLVLFHLLHKLIYRFSPIHRSRRHSFAVRVFDVTYETMTAAAGIVAGLLVLYASGDWVLLSLAVIFLLGVAWAARHTLPRIWEQLKLVMNLGQVREGERVVFEGLPYQVRAINIFSRLDNPELTGGTIRLPLRALLDMHSRPFEQKEPWFPTREGDWVILADGTLAKVVVQSPEVVELVLRGGARKNYRTTEFLAQAPLNLSHNFRIKAVFGVDYAHQAEVTTEIPDALSTEIHAGLVDMGFKEHIKSIKVEFCGAGASSLDMEVLADFAGSAADKHNILTRALPRLCVDSCTRHGWTIPFAQVVVHTAGAAAPHPGEA